MSLRKLTAGNSFQWEWYKTRSIGENVNTNSVVKNVTWSFTDNTAAKYVNKFAAWQQQLLTTSAVTFDFDASGSNTDITDFHGDVQTFTGLKELIITHESGTVNVRVSITGVLARWLYAGTDEIPEGELSPPVFTFHLFPGGSLHILCPVAAGYPTSTDSTLVLVNSSSGTSLVNIGIAGKG